jgi:PleD family two-component response regulator
MSFGVALADADASDPSAVFAVADEALYRAKRDGRDCVRLGEAPDSGIAAPVPTEVG